MTCMFFVASLAYSTGILTQATFSQCVTAALPTLISGMLLP